MGEVKLHKDAMILAFDSPIPVSYLIGEQVRCEVERRLGISVYVYDPTDRLESVETCAESIFSTLIDSDVTRACLITIDGDPTIQNCFHATKIWGLLETLDHKLPELFMAPKLGPQDWAELIACSPLARSHAWSLVPHSVTSINTNDYEAARANISQTVWELRRLGVRADFRGLNDPPTSPSGDLTPHIEVTWGSRWYRDEVEPVVLEIQSSRISHLPIQQVFPPSAWAHVCINKFLEAFSSPLVYLGHINRNVDESYAEFNLRMDELLPSEYRGKINKVSPQSMGSASLRFDEHGRVPWGEIWTSFCDLALAGGPPHRGTLLEAVSREECEANPVEYEQVIDEISRGVRLAAQLDTIRSEIPGWIGVVCDDEEMAAWLMRAIITENVMVRREGNRLYLPAGPKFRLKREIKNVIVSVAKTVHYWRHYRRSSGLSRGPDNTAS